MILLYMFIPLIAVLLIFYYTVVISELLNDDFETKKEFLLALIPFEYWISTVKKYYNELV
jgi:hypothetical protein